MILLFDNNSPNLNWCRAENGNISCGSCALLPSSLDKMIKDIGDISKIEAIGYLLRHDSNISEKQTVLLTERLLDKMRNSFSLFPEYSNEMIELIDYWKEKLPNAPQVVISDTAFFNNLPPQAGNYAVPYELCKKGIRRYGGYGLFHSWAVESVRSKVKSPLSKIISVYIGDRTNIAAVKDGQAVETSTGFTPVEGILSSTGCGDIDPTIIFYLQSTGQTIGQITNLLSNQSGFTALMNRPASLKDIINDGDDAKKTFEIYLYQVKRYIGSFISVLGGVDAVVFIAEKPKIYDSIIIQICQELQFLGLKCKIDIQTNNFLQDLTDNASHIKVFSLSCNKWEIMVHNIRNLLDSEK